MASRENSLRLILEGFPVQMLAETLTIVKGLSWFFSDPPDIVPWIRPRPLPAIRSYSSFINLLKPTGHVMHQQFNVQQLYALPTLYLCVLYLSENKQRLVPLTV
jgi:hypothetical protein